MRRWRWQTEVRHTRPTSAEKLERELLADADVDQERAVTAPFGVYGLRFRV